MVEKIKIYPKNKKHFLSLKKFAGEIINIFQKCKINPPLVYGGLAVFGYTKKRDLIIKDIDFYMHERDFEKFISALQKRKIKYNYSKKRHTLYVFKNKLKLEFDSIDYWYHGLSRFKNFDFDGLKVKVINLEELKKIYKFWAIHSDKHYKNKKKFEILRGLK